jgi:membrane-associated protease RseP (regulator of RpoE activity)
VQQVVPASDSGNGPPRRLSDGAPSAGRGPGTDPSDAPVSRDPVSEDPEVVVHDRRNGLTILAVMAVGLVLAQVFLSSRVIPGFVLLCVVLVPMVLFHEWGHWWTARRFGIASKEFFVGFGPRLWSFRRGETEYGIKAFFPLGGYVKIVGMSQYEDVEPEFEGRTFRDAKPWQRAVVLAAGSLTHFTTALVLLFVVLAFVGIPRSEPTTTLSSVQEGTPAAAVGIEPGDRLVSVNGTPVPDWETAQRELQALPGVATTVVVERDGVEKAFDVTIGRNPDDPTRGRLGVAPGVVESGRDREPVLAAVPEAFVWFARITVQNAEALVRTFTPDNVGKIADQVGGGDSRTDYRFQSFVGIGNIMVQIFGRGLFSILTVVIAINIFIGWFNLLPFLPLDGGHLAVLGVEQSISKVRRRPFEFDQRHLVPFTVAFMMLLFMIFLSSVYLDVTAPQQLPR